jgi:hypothetical protein
MISTLGMFFGSISAFASIPSTNNSPAIHRVQLNVSCDEPGFARILTPLMVLTPTSPHFVPTVIDENVSILTSPARLRTESKSQSRFSGSEPEATDREYFWPENSLSLDIISDFCSVVRARGALNVSSASCDFAALSFASSAIAESFKTSFCSSVVCAVRRAISAFWPSNSESEIVWSMSEDTHMSASQANSPRIPRITLQVAIATHGQCPAGAGIQRFSIFSACHSATNAMPTTIANITKPNSPNDSQVSAESLDSGVIGDPERSFQIRLGMTCMIAIGLAFAGWFLWGLIWLFSYIFRRTSENPYDIQRAEIVFQLRERPASAQESRTTSLVGRYPPILDEAGCSFRPRKVSCFQFP